MRILLLLLQGDHLLSDLVICQYLKCVDAPTQVLLLGLLLLPPLLH